MGICCIVSNAIDTENVIIVPKKEERNKIKETGSKFSLSKKDTNINEDIHCESLELSKYSENEFNNECPELNIIKINIDPIESAVGSSGFVNKDDYEIISNVICQTTCNSKQKIVSKKKSSKSLKRNKNSLFSAVKEDKYHPQNKKSLKRIRMKLLTS